MPFFTQFISSQSLFNHRTSATAGATSTGATSTTATSTGASNTLLVVQFASYPLLYGISYICNGHSGIVFRVLCPKISTGWGKLAPAGWHGWHVFATLHCTKGIKSYFCLVIIVLSPKFSQGFGSEGQCVNDTQNLNKPESESFFR